MKNLRLGEQTYANQNQRFPAYDSRRSLELDFPLTFGPNESGDANTSDNPPRWRGIERHSAQRDRNRNHQDKPAVTIPEMSSGHTTSREISRLQPEIRRREILRRRRSTRSTKQAQTSPAIMAKISIFRDYPVPIENSLC